MSSNNNHNKYELRSTDVQEVMNKPPSRLIIWGNTVIILTLLIGFWLLTLFRLPVTYETAFKIRKIKQFNKARTLIDLTIIKSIQGNFNIHFPTTAKLFLSGSPTDKYDSMLVILDSIAVSKKSKNLKLYIVSLNKSQNNPSIIKLKKGMSGKISIKTGTESVLKKLSEQIF